jgi:putative restriction endonuclease
MCGLSRPELIEAAPIAAAAEPGRRLMVTNGLALCAMHRAAFDGQLVGVDPAGTIHVRGDVADEVDRPMLRPGLQALAGRPLRLPTRRRDHPDRDALKARFARFCRAEGAA